MRFANILLLTLPALAVAGAALAEPSIQASVPAAVEAQASKPVAKAETRRLGFLFGKRTSKTRAPEEAVLSPPTALPLDDFVMQMPISLKRVRPPRGLA